MFKKKGRPVQLKNLDMDEYRQKIFYSPNGTDNRLLASLTREEFDMRIAAEFDEKKSNFNWTVV